MTCELRKTTILSTLFIREGYKSAVVNWQRQPF